MKKLLLSTFGILLACQFNFLKAQPMGIIANSLNLCSGSSGYATVSPTIGTATSYSWSVLSTSCTGNFTPGTNGWSILASYPCCGVYTISCTAYNGTVALITGTQVVTVSCLSATTPTILSSAPNNTLCAGNSATLTGMGCATYTWLPLNSAFPSVVVAPTANTCYTLQAQNASGCFATSNVCTNVVPAYTISVAGNTQVCIGSSTTLSLSGGPSFVTLPGNINSPNPVLSPSISMMYTICSPGPTAACASTLVLPIIVNPTPTITTQINGGGSGTLCPGQTRTLVAFGSTTYTWSTGATTPSIVVMPFSSSCYSVIGINNITTCTNSAVYCLTVMPLPTLSISGPSSVCLGSSATFSVSGASSYTWQTTPAVIGSTINVVPTLYQQFTVSATGANGCNVTYTTSVFTDTSCAIVWPGDANRDGSVSNLDVLELGLAAGSTGAARTTTGNAWAGAFATAWTGSVSTGWNKVHADCNGDGIVNSSDNAAITQNFALVHSFKESGSSAANPEISLVPAQLNAYAGIWNKADIMLGDASNAINQLYGVAFDITYDMNMVQPDSVKILFTPSFFNSGNQNINFGKTIYANGKLYAATVRVDHNDVNGNGKIGEFWYKVKSGLPSNAVINLSVVNAQKVSTSAAFNTLSTAPSQSLSISANVVSILNNTDLDKVISMFPNPSNNLLNLRSDLGSTIVYTLYDISGRVILNGDFIQAKTLEVKNLAKGAYFIRFQSNGQSCTKQVMIEN